MNNLLRFQPPENPQSHRFDQLMRTEMERLQKADTIESPEMREPLILPDYAEMIREKGLMPTPEQFQRFVEDFQDDNPFSKLVGIPGLQVCPAIMPYSHDMRTFSSERIEKYGYLTLNAITGEGFTFGAEDPVYLSAVLPPDLLRKLPQIPEKFDSIESYSEFNESVIRAILRLVKLSSI